MQDIYIVEAARSPIGKRGKGLAGLMPADLLGKVQRGALERAGLDPANVGQVIGGCVSQVNQQSFNIARIAWLSQGFPEEVAATTVDSQCGSSQQATSMGAAMIGSGMEDVVMACGVEDDVGHTARLQYGRWCAHGRELYAALPAHESVSGRGDDCRGISNYPARHRCLWYV